MDEPVANRLAFHIESPQGASETLNRKLAQIDGVQTVETHVLQPARAIDAQTVGTILVLITATTKAGVTVTGHLEQIIRNVKKIAAESGLTRVYIEHQRKKQDVNLLGPEDLNQLAEDTAVPNGPAGP